MIHSEHKEESPRNTALQLLDTIAFELPNTEVMPVVLGFAQSAAAGEVKEKRAALSALAVICEGCASPLIEGGHTENLVQFSCDIY